MKKILAVILGILVISSMLLLAGCDEKKTEDLLEKVFYGDDDGKAETKERETNEPKETESKEKTVVKVTMEIKSDSKEIDGVMTDVIYPVISGYNKIDVEMWSMSTKPVPEGGLQPFTEVGVVGDTFVFNNDGTVFALFTENGTTAWMNMDFHGHGATAAFDEASKTVYLTSADGPALYVIDKDGKTVTSIDSFGEGLSNPEIKELKDGKLIINIKEGGKKVIVDTSDYSYTVE